MLASLRRVAIPLSRQWQRVSPSPAIFFRSEKASQIRLFGIAWGKPAWDDRVSGLDDGSESTIGQEGHYTGGWDIPGARPHGVGIMRWDNGITYEGEWQEGKFHGMGFKKYSRGGGYEGEWVNGKRQGRGSHIFAGKFGYERWEGPFIDDQPHGVGTMHYADGTKGQFEFQLGKPVTVDKAAVDHQLDTLHDGSPSTQGVAGHYKGGWDADAGKPHGFGVMEWENGIEYKGCWVDGVYHGHGRKLYSRGGGYEGQWVNGKREGMGISFYGKESLGKHGVLRWEGPFLNDKPHGLGQAYVAADMEGDERWEGDTAVKGPTIEFVEGVPQNFP